MKITHADKLMILLGLFIGSLLAANFLGAKITSFAPPTFIALPLNVLFAPIFFVINAIAALLPTYGTVDNPFLSYSFFNVVHVSVGILMVPVMFLITDIVSETHGKEMSRKFVYVGVIVMLFTLLITAISVALPPDPTRQYFSQDAYASIFGISLRIIVASVTAYFLAQLHDIWTFQWIKRKTQGKYFWMRKTFSTVVGQFIDSVIFMFIAFYGISPRFTAVYIFSLIIPYWIFKILFAFLDTPFVYAGVRWLERDKHHEHV